MIRYIKINDLLDFHVVKKCENIFKKLFWNLISNLVLCFFLRSVYVHVARSNIKIPEDHWSCIAHLSS